MPAAATPPAPTRRGACPGVFDPMEAADGWLVRIRVPAGRITSAQLMVVADVAEHVGSGVVEVTSRANLQLRGVAEVALEQVGARLLDAGLAAANATADARRAVVSSPLAGHDATEVVDVSSAADAVLAALAAAALPPLPAKFGVVIDGGGDVSVRHVPGTLCLGAGASAGGGVSWQAAFGTSLSAGPTVDVGPLSASELAALVVDAARTAADDPTASLQRHFRHPGEAVDDSTGADHRRDDPAASLQPRFRHPGEAVDLPGHSGDPGGRPPAAPGGRSRPSGAALGWTRVGIGVLAHPVPGRANVVANVFLGRTDASAIAAIAGLADRAMAVRTAPGGWALLGVPEADVADMVDALAALGFVVDPGDPRVGITGCVGAPGCASARADTATAAHELASARRGASTSHRADPVTSAPPSRLGGHRFGTSVHLSACEKMCGAPAGAAVLVADEHGHFVAEGAT